MHFWHVKISARNHFNPAISCKRLFICIRNTMNHNPVKPDELLLLFHKRFSPPNQPTLQHMHYLYSHKYLCTYLYSTYIFMYRTSFVVKEGNAGCLLCCCLLGGVGLPTFIFFQAGLVGWLVGRYTEKSIRSKIDDPGDPENTPLVFTFTHHPAFSKSGLYAHP